MRIVTKAAALSMSLFLIACDSGNEMAAPSPAPMTSPQPAPAPVVESAPALVVESAPLTTNDDSLLAEPTWAVLFSGRDLVNFNRTGGGNWQFVDGYIQADTGEPGFLVTKGAYTDFQLRVEFQATAESNSGIFIRCEDPNAVSAESCYEINVFDQNQNPNNRTGAIVNLVPPATSIMAGDAWNTFDITAQGRRVTVRLNGTVTADVEDDKHGSGYIALQYNMGLIRFRDARLRPL